MRVLFMGSPEFAVPVLEAIHSEFEVVGVVTRADKPKGRGRRTTPTAVKETALRLGLPVLQPHKLSDPGFREAIEELRPDIAVVTAYGKILPLWLLRLPRLGCVNLHASLLPRYRGASPITAAVLHGDTVSGVTTIAMDEGMDTGAVLLMREVALDPDETMGTLHDKLMNLGAELTVETLRGIVAGRIAPRPQDHSLATYTRPLKKEDARIDWSASAQRIERLVRAMDPRPGAFYEHGGERIRVHKVAVAEGSGAPGTVLAVNSQGVLVASGAGAILVVKVQPPGKPAMDAADYARGKRLAPGMILE